MRADRTAVVHFGSQVGRTLAGFVGTLYIARTLGSAPFGTYVLGIAVVTWLHIPTDAVGSAITKRVSEGKAHRAFLSAGFLVIAALAIGIGGVLFLLDGLIEGYLDAGVAKFVAALFAGKALFIGVTAGLDGQKKVAQSGFIRMIEQVCRTGLHITLIVFGYGLPGLFLGHVGALVVSSGVGLLLFDYSFSVPEREHFQRLVEYARYSWLNRVQARSLDWIDTLVLGLFVSSSLIGIYEVAWTIASTLSLVTVSIATTLFPEISELDSEGMTDRIRTLLNDAMVFASLLVIPGLFGAVVVGNRVLAIYGSEFTAGGAVLILLVGTRVCTSFSTMFLKAINGLNQPNVAFRIAVIFLSVNLVLNIVLVATVGWIGAAIATLFSAAVSAALSYRSVARIVGPLDIPVSTLAKQVISGIGMAVVVSVFDTLVTSNHVVTVVLVVGGAAIYMTLLLGISPRLRTRLLATISRA